MKSFVIITLLSLGAACFAGFVTDAENFRLEKGCLIPLESGKLLFDGNFKGKSPDWIHFENYEDRLKFSYETMEGSPVLAVRHATQGGGDVAWHFRSRQIPLTGMEKRILLNIDSRVTTNLDRSRGDEDLSTRVIWYDKSGKNLSSTPFRYSSCAQIFTVSQVALIVPAGAASLAVQFGNDDPNIGGNTYQAYRSIKVFGTGEQKNFTGVSSYVSQVFTGAKGTVSWEGDFPADAAPGLQISWAGEKDGVLGQWSPFAGPNGKSDSFYKNGSNLAVFPSDAKYFRYKFTLRSGVNASVIRSVKVGNFTDIFWDSFFDPHAPLVFNRTPVSTDLKKLISAEIRDNSVLDWTTLQFTVDGKDVTKAVTRKGNTLTYRTPVPYEKRLHTFIVTISDVEGSKTVAKRHFDFVSMPQNNVITLRDDGMVLIDGKPFFPIGIYAMSMQPCNNMSYDKGFQDAKEAGFTMAHTYSPVRERAFYHEFLPAAKKHGFKLFIPGPEGANSQNVSALLATVQKEKHIPEILAWYLADDASGFNTPEGLAEISDAVKAVDPSRITCQADGVGGFTGFANSTDIFLPEIYPVTEIDAESSDKCVSKVIQGMKTVHDCIENEGNPTVAVWAIIQYFKGWCGWKRYPTPQELRAMSYAAIIHGATGIIWYTYGGDQVKNFGVAATPENGAVMSKVSKELNSLVPVFCERKPEKQPVIKILSGPARDLMGYDSISGLLKMHDGKSYWFTVNSSVKTVKVSFALPGYKKGKVLFENRDVTVEGGILTDTFLPYAVHVYELQ